MKKLVIFDLDGTLLNTISDLGEAANFTLARHGFPTHHISSYPHFVGNGISKLIERVLPAENRDEATVATLREDFVEYYNQHKTDHTEPYPGIKELLARLNDAGIAMAVASNKYQEAAQDLITHYFPEIPWVAIQGQVAGIPTKPDPSPVFAILGIHPTPKAEAVMVGDSAVDIETARRAAIDSIGVTWGFGKIKDLTDAYADNIADTTEQVYKFITKNRE